MADRSQLFHIYRNTPVGRETLLHSLYFCQQSGMELVVYVPREEQFLLYFKEEAVQVDLDSSYLTATETAVEHVHALAAQFTTDYRFFEPEAFTESMLPDIPTDFGMMCCPRSISDLSVKIGVGFIGGRVRKIISCAEFPVLLSSLVFRPWNSLAVFFGGSVNALRTVRLGLRLSRMTGMPMDIFTQAEDLVRKDYEEMLEVEGLLHDVKSHCRTWRVFVNGKIEENVYEVLPDALVILGTHGPGMLKGIMFGSFTETIQSTLVNPIVVVGPRFHQPF